MKSILLTSLLLMAAPVLADCEGGTEASGVNNHHTYCVSDIRMNWWSAHSWCRANNRHLATLEEACHPEMASCSNLKQIADVDDVWLATPNRGSYAYHVVISSGVLYGYGHGRSTAHHALCY